MRFLTSLCFALLLGVVAVATTDPAHAQDVSSPAPVEPGAVLPEPFDPNLAKLNKGECRKLAKRIIQYTEVAERANARDDELWEASTVAHVDRLEARWNNMCANEDDSFARAFRAALKTAGRLALKYFTMGYY